MAGAGNAGRHGAAARRGKLAAPRRPLLALLVASAFAGGALANPTGPNVVHGQASFSSVGSTLTVTNSPNAIIQWQGFSIGANEATRFQQQSAASAVLNRVVGQDPSAILGQLWSNGRVFLVNPNGILFGAGARIDVAGLVASTLNLTDQDFLAGRLRFEAGAVASPIINQGTIATPPGGQVHLIAPNVENHGVIQTPQGQTILAAGKTVQLVEADVPNLRVEIQAGGEALNVGQILADGGRAGIYAGLINQQGIVRANTVSRDATGKIVLRSEILVNTGTLQAEGVQGGSVEIGVRNVLSAGRISAGGSEGVGGEVNVQASGRILQTAGAHVSADGAAGGGKVTLQAADRVFGSGTLTATGRGAGSTGGEIKVLADEVVLLDAHLDAGGNAGGGTVLVGGDFQGKNSAIQNARTNQINFSTTINADARTSGNGGKVIVWSDVKTEFYGTIGARGGAQLGDGGFIEVSGKETLVFGGAADAGAPNGKPGTLLLDPKFIVIDAAGGGGGAMLLADPNPGAGDQYAQAVTVLTNDNIVATDPNDDFAATNAGAVYLFNGTTGALISTLTGSTANSNVGSGGVTVLTSGNYVVSSPNWDNGATLNVGAVTFGSGATGISGAVSATNSLVGTTANDNVGGGSGGGGVTALTNGNYVVRSTNWDNGAVVDAGAATFVNGTTGMSGVVSVANSLVSGTAGSFVGNGGVTELTNGNYVVVSASWRNGAAGNAGAVTFGSGTTGVSGVVSATNSLVGGGANNRVGGGGVIALTNGNYVVRSQLWDNGAATDAGAVTFGSGTTGVSGVVSATNSLVGSTLGDSVGFDGVIKLTNGNYVVVSRGWDNGAATDAGAVTFGSGTTGVSGLVSATNSLVGSTTGDRVGLGGVIALSNGNYVVVSQNWNNGAVNEVGAVTFGNGTTGVSGVVSAANSLVGSTALDFVGSGGVTALTNGNYVVASPSWDNGAVANVGAVTFVNGTTGMSGVVSAANSLVGGGANNQVGLGGVIALTNGNYVVRSSGWDNGAATNAGAVTFGNGTTGVTGVVSAANSLVGTTTGDQVGVAGGGGEVVALSNGNYVVRSQLWDNGAATDAGAVTFGSGTTGISGAVSAANSLVGTTANDQVGSDGVTALSNGNYVVRSLSWDNGAATDAGAVTFGNGTTGVTGVVSAANSLVGSTTFDRGGLGGVIALSNGNYVVVSLNWNNVGAVTFGNGTTGVSGVVSAANSLIGSTAGDSVGGSGVTALTNGNYVVVSQNWSNGAVANVGAVTFGSGTTGISGAVSAANSLVGTIANDQVGSGGVAGLSNGSFVVRSPLADNAAIVDAGLVHLVTTSGGPLTNPLPFANDPAGTATISPAQITAITNTGSSVVLQANTDITVNSAIVASNPSGAGGSLTLQAGRSLLINANIVTDGGAFTGRANEGTASGVVDSNRDPGSAVIAMAPGTTIDVGSGAIVLELGSGGGLTNSSIGDVTLANLTASGGISVATPGSMVLTGSVSTGGGALAFNAGGNITLSAGRIASSAGGQTISAAGNLFLQGGGAASAYAEITAAPGATQNISALGNVLVNGGSGSGAYARIYGDPDAKLTVGGVLQMNSGSGTGSYARVESASATSIVLAFPNLASGGYSVNGVDGATYDAATSSGFLAGGQPAVLGQNLLVSYGASIVPPPPGAFEGVASVTSHPLIDSAILVASEKSADTFQVFELFPSDPGASSEGAGDEDRKRAIPRCN